MIFIPMPVQNLQHDSFEKGVKCFRGFSKRKLYILPDKGKHKRAIQDLSLELFFLQQYRATNLFIKTITLFFAVVLFGFFNPAKRREAVSVRCAFLQTKVISKQKTIRRFWQAWAIMTHNNNVQPKNLFYTSSGPPFYYIQYGLQLFTWSPAVACLIHVWGIQKSTKWSIFTKNK